MTADEPREAWEDALDDPEEPLYTVGVVADLMGVDVQVVRGYDKRGLVSPGRSEAGHRRYSRTDIQRLSRAMRLADEGIPAAGIGRILELEDELGARDGRGGPDAREGREGRPGDGGDGEASG